jgi:hypothetical protein
VNIAFQPRRASPSSLRNLCALRASALSFSCSFSRTSLPLCAHAPTPTTPVPSTIYFITRGHPRVGGTHPRRLSSVNSAHSALRPTRFVSPVDPSKLVRPHLDLPRPPLTAVTITPLSAMLTKNKGEGAGPKGDPGPVLLPGMTAYPLPILPPPLSRAVRCELLALSLEGSTVSSAPAGVSPLSATLTKKPGGRVPCAPSLGP